MTEGRSLLGSPRMTPPPSVVSGRILTMNPAMPVAQAMGIAHGRIQCVGTLEEVRQAMGGGVQHLDYGQGVIVPGFIDSHNHMLWTGIQQQRVDLSGCRNIAELLRTVREYRQAHPEQEWVVSGEGWHIEKLEEKRYPTRRELDEAVPDRPVYLPRVGHVACVNSVALKLAGIGPDTPDPTGGKICRDAQGEPDGLLIELPAFNQVGRLVPPASRQMRCDALREIQKKYHATGITGVVEPGLQADDMSIYQELWRQGELTVRTVAMPQAQIDQDPDVLMNSLASWPVRTGFGDERFKLGAIKVYLDGGASLNTALMREPYPDERCQCGIQVTHTDVFHRLVEFCARTGWSIGVHAVGGKAIDRSITFCA